jgi:23S rRNA (cytidine1920-2'-O)/16S rRNA (cytidine1409-2'-O)-methyltransferase
LSERFVSRGGLKLDAALAAFGLDVTGFTCADLGCSTGGFTDCLLQRGAAKVFAVDTGYGVLAWTLRKDPRVVVMERQNALHATLPEEVDLVVIDAGWTRQGHILPAAAKLLKPTGSIVTLIKPHYEAERSQLRKGILPDDLVGEIVARTLDAIRAAVFTVKATIDSPIRGQKGNAEVLAWLVP